MKPTQAQIDAAAKAIFLTMQYHLLEWHKSTERLCKKCAIAALDAAAEVGPNGIRSSHHGENDPSVRPDCPEGSAAAEIKEPTPEENVAYYEKAYADDLAIGRNPYDFGMRWMQSQIMEWKKEIRAAAEVGDEEVGGEQSWKKLREQQARSVIIVNATIERCAQVAEQWTKDDFDLPAAIRKLKEEK